MLDSLQIDPIAFTIPIGDGFAIYWYGILITLGIAIGAVWASREINHRLGEKAVDEFYNGLIVAIISGFLFARITYVVLDVLGGAVYTSLGDVFNIRQGGINILGGFIGAFFFAYAYVRLRKLNFWHYADVAGPALLIAQGIGRWGNFINQELYGPPTEQPWGILIEPRFRLPQFADLNQFPVDTRFHPTFLYESIWLLVGFGLLLWLNQRYRGEWKPGTLFGLFLVWWGIGRTWIEFFRPDQVTIGGSIITYSMVMAFGLAVAGVIVLLERYDKLPESARLQRRRNRKRRKPKPRRSTDS
jgi:phosphatidylglycerol---prolipoprotein diacylglyceryl transferase